MSSERKNKSVLREYAEAIVIAVILALFIRTFVIQAFKIPSGSMLPTLQIGDHLLVNKFIYGIRVPFTGKLLVPITTPRNGDVIVFRFPEDRSTDYIKRVIGIPGDRIELRNKQLLVNGEKVQDPHAYYSSTTLLPGSKSPTDNFGPITVPEGKLFVMGDNRDNSYDSRFWGYVDDKDLLGKALIIYWSWDIKKPLLSAARLMSIRWKRIGDIIH
ncbi:MAG: signal peptidase I [Proteobacteria bacterium]|nr:MAG: signal peptidase I [Pseudomonadota bacterium]PIE65247.1 MAG: signal peptidase I [Desulfobacterales bacterium]